MSATINEQIFISKLFQDPGYPANRVDYFGGCPSLHIPGFTHPVQDRYVDGASRPLTTGI